MKEFTFIIGFLLLASCSIYTSNKTDSGGRSSANPVIIMKQNSSKNTSSEKLDTISDSLTKMGNVIITVTLEKRFSRVRIPNFTIEFAKLSCNDLPIMDEKEEIISHKKPTSPIEWCDSIPLNLPVTSNEKGDLQLLFNLKPSPLSSGIEPSEGLLYNVPMLYWKSSLQSGAIGIETLSASEWNASIAVSGT